jgi:hypothetical protein
MIFNNDNHAVSPGYRSIANGLTRRLERILAWISVIVCGAQLGTAEAAVAVSDNFDRPNGSLGTNWGSIPESQCDVVIVNDQAGADQVYAECFAYWQANTFSDNQYSQATIPQIDSFLDACVNVRSDSSDRFYVGEVTGPNAYDLLARWDGNWYVLASGSAATWQDGDTLRLEVTGSADPIKLTLYRNGSPVLTTYVGASAGTPYVRTGGNPGLGFGSQNGGNLTLDNWEGGDLDSMRLVITGSGTQGAGGSQNLTITAEDANGNTVTNYTGSKSLTFSGAHSSVNPVTAPTVTDTNGMPIPFGSPTVINFSNGVATVSGGKNGAMTLYKAETAIISASDGPSFSYAGFEANYLSTDVYGVESYLMNSAYNASGDHVLRVLRPNNPVSGVAHNFLYVLPVEPEGSSNFGDGLTTLRELNAHNQYNVTLIAPSFPIDPWYADHATNSNYKFESFMCLELQPWVTAILASTGYEQHWLLGFSKSGFGGIDLLLKHPDLFTLGAFWDFPATGFTMFDQFGSSSAANYGTDANFQANYRLTPAFVQTYEQPFLIDNRIWISGYQAYQQDLTDFDALLTATGIAHTLATPVLRVHSWDSGWVPLAVGGLYQNSLNLGKK